jgi:RNA polymerase sigma-70 factor (ECF subfamily)
MATGRGLTTSPTLLGGVSDLRNDEAWRGFLALYKPLILADFRRLGLQPRYFDDLYQEVVSKLVRAMPGFVYDPSKRFRGWLKTLVKHEVFGFYRRRGPHTVPLDDRDVEDVSERLGSDLERLGWALQAAERVRRRTNPKHWEAFWRWKIEGEESREVARDLGMSLEHFYVKACLVARSIRAETALPDRDPGVEIETETIDELMSRLREAERPPGR